MTQARTRADKFLEALRNHPLVAVFVVIAAIIAGAAAFSDGLEKLFGIVVPERQPTIAAVLTRTRDEGRLLHIVVHNPNRREVLLKHIRIEETSGFVEPRTQCANDAVFFLADSIHLRPITDTTWGFLGEAHAREGPTRGFSVPAFGVYSSECGARIRRLILEFDALVTLPPVAHTGVFLTIPATLLAHPTLFRERFRGRNVPQDIPAVSPLDSWVSMIVESEDFTRFRSGVAVRVDSLLRFGHTSYERRAYGLSVQLLTNSNHWVTHDSVIAQP